jgi:hypothetical protein
MDERSSQFLSHKAQGKPEIQVFGSHDRIQGSIQQGKSSFAKIRESGMCFFFLFCREKISNKKRREGKKIIFFIKKNAKNRKKDYAGDREVARNVDTPHLHHKKTHTPER